LPPTRRTEIVILGGGFAGVTTAEQLEKQFRDDPTVAASGFRTPSSQLAAIGSPFRGERGTPSQADRNTGSSTLVVCLGRWNTAPNCFDVMNL
jgi:hypothetical protein